MPAKFAAIRVAGPNPVGRIGVPHGAVSAANDDACGSPDDERLRAALLHFAAHGLGAAQNAFDRAEHAIAVGDRGGAAKWADICRLLDKRLAAGLVSGAGR